MPLSQSRWVWQYNGSNQDTKRLVWSSHCPLRGNSFRIPANVSWSASQLAADSHCRTTSRRLCTSAFFWLSIASFAASWILSTSVNCVIVACDCMSVICSRMLRRIAPNSNSNVFHNAWNSCRHTVQRQTYTILSWLTSSYFSSWRTSLLSNESSVCPRRSELMHETCLADFGSTFRTALRGACVRRYVDRLQGACRKLRKRLRRP